MNSLRPASDANVVLSVEGLAGGYGDVDIIQSVDLEVRRDEIVALIGPNGAGKSTLLKAIVGLAHVRTGTIKLNDSDISGLRTEEIVRSGLSYVPQVSNVFPSLTVLENFVISFPKGEGKDLVNKRVQLALDLFPSLHSRLRVRAQVLSGGERQMVALARAILVQPEVLLLDEPTAALAPSLARSIFEKLVEINRTGVAILLVEQNARMALETADRGYVLDSGRTAITGPAAGLLDDPRIKELYLGG